jgi:uncharacterized protein YrrD
MKYASQITGLKVVAHDTGEAFKKVVDITFDEHTNRLVGLITQSPGLVSEGKVIPFPAVESIGEDAVVVPNKDVEVSVEDDPATKMVLNSSAVNGKTVMTEDGRDLGKVADLEIDEKSGKITAYKTSGGLFADAYKGRPSVPADMTVRIGEDVVFVPNHTADVMEQQVGGLKAAGQSVAEKAAELKDQALEKGKEAAGGVQAKAGELKEKATSEETKSTTGDFMESIKQKAVELKDQATAKIEETRINAALGKPASRVVLDKQDNPILNVGDIITHEAVEKAREAGVLEVLLGSVYKKGPELSTEEMKYDSK